MELGYGIILDDKSHNYVRSIELELCDKFGLCWGLKQSPHITVKSTFEVKKVKPYADYLDKLAKNITPFEITLRGFNYFEPKKVIFLDVVKNKKLLVLHLKIIKDLEKKYKIKPNQFEGENVKFHSTVACRDVTKGKFIKAKKYLKNKNPKFTFKFNTIALFYLIGKEREPIIIKRVKLKKS